MTVLSSSSPVLADLTMLLTSILRMQGWHMGLGPSCRHGRTCLPMNFFFLTSWNSLFTMETMALLIPGSCLGGSA